MIWLLPYTRHLKKQKATPMTQARKQTTEQLKTTIKNLGQNYLSNYPETSISCRLFIHRNQAIATKLSKLTASTADDLIKELEDIYKHFDQAGTLLREIHQAVLNSNLYPKINSKHNEIQNHLDELVRISQDSDTGKWEMCHYRSAICTTKYKGSIEMRASNHL